MATAGPDGLLRHDAGVGTVYLLTQRFLYPSDFKKPGRQASGEGDERILNT